MLRRIIPGEMRKRGALGWIFLLLFLAFNAFMAWGLLSGTFSLSQLPIRDEAEEARHNFLGVFGLGTVLLMWLAGAVILGLLAALTRGSKTSEAEAEAGDE